jgi:hypothetical protein
MSTLAQLEARVSARLVDATNVTFSLATIDEALRTALSEYSQACPQGMEGILVLPATGREIALDSFANLVTVLDVWWPYDTLSEVWPPNQVAGFRVWWDDARPVLLLASKTGSQPRALDTIRVWYTRPQTISSLDSATTTSVFAMHESGLVTGAAAYAVVSQMRKQIGTVRVDPSEVPALKLLADSMLAEFHNWLEEVSTNAPSSGAPFAEGWGIDKWDANGEYPGGSSNLMRIASMIPRPHGYRGGRNKPYPNY